MASDLCERVIRVIDADVVPATEEEAAAMAEDLLSWFPNIKPHAVDSFVEKMMAVFQSYPRSAGNRVLDAVNGPLSRTKYLPSVPDVNSALASEMEQRQRIKANARGHIWEANRRRKAREDAEREAAWERNRSSPEERARVVAEALKGFNRMGA